MSNIRVINKGMGPGYKYTTWVGPGIFSEVTATFWCYCMAALSAFFLLATSRRHLGYAALAAVGTGMHSGRAPGAVDVSSRRQTAACSAVAAPRDPPQPVAHARLGCRDVVAQYQQCGTAGSALLAASATLLGCPSCKGMAGEERARAAAAHPPTGDKALGAGTSGACRHGNQLGGVGASSPMSMPLNTMGLPPLMLYR